MDRDAVLAAFDEQVRRRPQPDTAGDVVERDDRVVRVASLGGWCGVTWSDLDASCADAVVAEQVRRFAETGRPWEWKHYSYDEPADLPDRLVRAGFVAEPAETLLVAEIADLADLAADGAPPSGTEIVPVGDARGVAALVRVHDEVFGGDHADLGRTLLARIGEDPVPVVAAVVVAGSQPVSAGRVELPPDGEFASLWGGGTVAEWRGRGVFRALVAWRARVAAARGYRYVYVDASPDSRPILERLGFVTLATTTPYQRRQGQ